MECGITVAFSVIMRGSMHMSLVQTTCPDQQPRVGKMRQSDRHGGVGQQTPTASPVDSRVQQSLNASFNSENGCIRKPIEQPLINESASASRGVGKRRRVPPHL